MQSFALAPADHTPQIFHMIKLHAVYLIPATPFEGLVLYYLLTVIYDVTVTIKIYLVT